MARHLALPCLLALALSGLVACKPAVLAETDDYVAFGSEYRALVTLPGIKDARVWEPEPATVYFWER